MHCLSITPLAREHAERLAREDERKAAEARAVRLQNMRIWKRNKVGCAGLMPFTPKRRSKPLTEDRRTSEFITSPRPCNIAMQKKRQEKTEQVLQALSLFPEGARIKQLADATNLSVCTTRLCLRDLLKEGKVSMMESSPGRWGNLTFTFHLAPTAAARA
jgi:predicted transcriptional regulator